VLEGLVINEDIPGVILAVRAQKMRIKSAEREERERERDRGRGRERERERERETTRKKTRMAPTLMFLDTAFLGLLCLKSPFVKRS
jgi:hypothetical protein